MDLELSRVLEKWKKGGKEIYQIEDRIVQSRDTRRLKRERGVKK